MSVRAHIKDCEIHHMIISNVPLNTYNSRLGTWHREALKVHIKTHMCSIYECKRVLGGSCQIYVFIYFFFVFVFVLFTFGKRVEVSHHNVDVILVTGLLLKGHSKVSCYEG